MRYTKQDSHSVHSHTFAPSFHHRTGSSLQTVKLSLSSARVRKAGESTPGKKAPMPPISEWLDKPENGYLMVLIVLAALVSFFLLK